MRKIRMRVVGVSFGNNYKRLEKIYHLDICDKYSVLLRLKKEKNEHDKHAVRVEARIKEWANDYKVWKKIGHVPKKISKLVRKAMDNGKFLGVEFVSIGKNKKNGKLGLLLRMRFCD